MTAPMIIVDGISKAYGSVQALKQMSLQVRGGEVVCLIGPSGSGKTTLIRCINHLERPDSGMVYVDSQPMGYSLKGTVARELKKRELVKQRSRIGMVFQTFNLFPHLTAAQNVMLSPVRTLGMSKPTAVARARELLARVGLADKFDSYPAQLSGGQQQRVGIARALAMDPLVLLFDEPTSALDPELVREVLDVMKALAADGMTMVVCTHEISFARDVADSVLFMEAGEVVEYGPPSVVLDNPQKDRTRSFLTAIK